MKNTQDKSKTRFYLFNASMVALFTCFSIPILISAHWITGKGGYAISLFYLISGIIIVYSAYKDYEKYEWRYWKIICWIWFAALIWWKLNFIYIILTNNGWYPCNLGASCP